MKKVISNIFKYSKLLLLILPVIVIYGCNCQESFLEEKLTLLAGKVHMLALTTKVCVLTDNKDKICENKNIVNTENSGLTSLNTPWGGTIELKKEENNKNFEIIVTLSDDPSKINLSYGEKLKDLLKNTAEEIEVKDNLVKLVYKIN